MTQQEQQTSPTDQPIASSLSMSRSRMLAISQTELLCEMSHSTYDRLSFELRDHSSRERILKQSKFVWDQARALLRDISLLDTELDQGRGQDETTEKLKLPKETIGVGILNPRPDKDTK